MKKRTRKILAVLTVIAAVVCAFSIFMIIKEDRENKEDIKAFDELYTRVVLPVEEPEGNNATHSTNADIVPDEVLEALLYTKVSLDILKSENPDCVAWISIPDTVINYPVMHTPSEPNRYLYRNFNGKDSRAGVPFLEGGCRLDGDNVIIYAHNMLNGTMFAQLKKYLDYGYITKNPYVYLQTEEGVLVYEIFAVSHIKNDDVWYSYQVESEEADFDYLVGHLLENADYSTKNLPVFGDRLITLSTCHGKEDDDRLVVVGRLVEAKE